jgi:hypothetical protein
LELKLFPECRFKAGEAIRIKPQEIQKRKRNLLTTIKLAAIDYIDSNGNTNINNFIKQIKEFMGSVEGDNLRGNGKRTFNFLLDDFVNLPFEIQVRQSGSVASSPIFEALDKIFQTGEDSSARFLSVKLSFREGYIEFMEDGLSWAKSCLPNGVTIAEKQIDILQSRYAKENEVVLKNHRVDGSSTKPVRQSPGNKGGSI